MNKQNKYITHVIKIPPLAFSVRSSFWKYRIYDQNGYVLHEDYCSKRPRLIKLNVRIEQIPSYIVRFETSNRGYRSVTIYVIKSALDIRKLEEISEKQDITHVICILKQFPLKMKEDIINYLWG